jgi:predicted nuclease of predicted toxin-antitoxin system
LKILLDENLSRRLVPALNARWPGSSQVALLGLERASDADLCAYAAAQGFVICSKDDDFHRLVAARGYRPQLIHVALGNASNDQILSALLSAADRIEQALADPLTGVVVLGGVSLV